MCVRCICCVMSCGSDCGVAKRQLDKSKVPELRYRHAIFIWLDIGSGVRTRTVV